MVEAAIIGLDGVPYQLLTDLANQDHTPNIKELIKQGKIKKTRSSLPPNSAVSWTSVFTARNPGQHGIYGFTDFLQGTYTVLYHHSMRLKAQPFWQKNKDKRTLIINLPATYPPQPLNGAHISGFVSPQLDRAVQPPELVVELAAAGYEVDVTAPTDQTEIEKFLSGLNYTLKKRVQITKTLLDQKWDIMFTVFTGTDRIGHYLWDAYQDKSHKHHQDFIDYFTSIDNAVGEIVKTIGEDTPLIILSDHGMSASGTAFNLNTLLKQEGILRIEPNPELNYNAIKTGTTAFVAETNKIYLNTEKRFPRGSVKPSERVDITDELIDLLKSVRHNGMTVVKDTFTREELYEGPYTSEAPDLVVIPEKKFSFKTDLFKEELVSKDRLQGKHTEDNAFLYMNGSSAEFDEASEVMDALLVLRSMYGGLKI